MVTVEFPKGVNPMRSVPDVRKDPKKYIAYKNHAKIKKYLIAFKLSVTDDLGTDAMKVAKNKSVLKRRFDAKKKLGMNPNNFSNYETTESYDDELNRHFDEVESQHGFEGWEGDNYDFMGGLVGMGAKLLKKGVGAISKAVKDRKARKAAAAQGDQKADEAVKAEQATAHTTVRNNVLDVGMETWLDANKKRAIENLIQKGERDKQKSLIKAQLVDIGVDPRRFKSFESMDGDFNPKVKEILNDVLSHQKDVETKAATHDAMPKIMLFVALAAVGGYILAKKG